MPVDSPIDTLIHLAAGGIGGTTGAILTCPLEVVKTRLQSSNSGFGGLPPAGRPSNPADSKLSKAPKSSSFSVRRVVIPPEIATERPFQPTMPLGGNQNVVYSSKMNSRWMAKKYNPFESSMRVATRFYMTSKKGLSPNPQAQPNLNIFQCIR